MLFGMNVSSSSGNTGSVFYADLTWSKESHVNELLSHRQEYKKVLELPISD